MDDLLLKRRCLRHDDAGDSNAVRVLLKDELGVGLEILRGVVFPERYAVDYEGQIEMRIRT